MNLTTRAVLCDDIRREDNGKLLIIGAYDQNVVPDRVPFSQRLSLWLSVTGLSGSMHRFVMLMKFPGGNEVKTEDEVRLDVPNGAASMLFIGFPAQIQDYGEIIGEISFDGLPPIEFLRIPVSERPADQPSSDLATTKGA